MIDRLKKLLDPYDESCRHLECDGFTRVAHYLLDKESIDHDIWFGHIVLNQLPHYWITVGEDHSIAVDYRIRMWLKEGPHGIIAADEHRKWVSLKDNILPSEMRVPTSLFKASRFFSRRVRRYSLF